MGDTGMKATALEALQDVRGHVLGAVEDLGASDLRRTVLPSGWSILGLVNHLAMDVERFWFGAVVLGDPAAIAQSGTAADAWQVPPDTPAEAVLTAYRTACAQADRVLADASPAAAPSWWPAELFGDWRLDTVGEVVLHVVVETATHAGHLDAARELIDGRQWIVLT